MSENKCCCNEAKAPCCSSSTVNEIKNVSTKLTINDKLCALKVRWGIGRMDYKVNPGLFSIGNPNEESLFWSVPITS